MTRYRDGWITVSAALAAVGIWTAVAELGVGGVLGVFVPVAVVAGMFPRLDPRDGVPAGWGRCIATASGVGAVVVAAVGLVGIAGPVGLLVIGLVVLANPWSARWVRRRMSASQHTPADSPPSGDRAPVGVVPSPARVDLPEPPTTADLDDAALCWAWRRSYVDLQRSLPVAPRLMVVMERQQILDEMERRNPAGLAAWLGSGARAAGDPSRYITTRRRTAR